MLISRFKATDAMLYCVLEMGHGPRTPTLNLPNDLLSPQACEVVNSKQFRCPTPDVSAGTPPGASAQRRRRRKRQARGGRRGQPGDGDGKCEFEIKYHQDLKEQVSDILSSSCIPHRVCFSTVHASRDQVTSDDHQFVRTKMRFQDVAEPSTLLPCAGTQHLQST